MFMRVSYLNKYLFFLIIYKLYRYNLSNNIKVRELKKIKYTDEEHYFDIERLR